MSVRVSPTRQRDTSFNPVAIPPTSPTPRPGTGVGEGSNIVTSSTSKSVPLDMSFKTWPLATEPSKMRTYAMTPL